MLEKIALLDSHVIRALLIAIVGVIGMALSLFGVDDKLFSSKAEGFVDAVMLLVTAGGVVYAAYARITKPTPPITEKAVKRTEDLASTRVSSWLPFVLAVGLALTLSGCAAFGVENPQGFRDRALVAEQTVNGVIAATTSSLNAGSIKSDDAEYVRRSANNTRDLLSAAETAYDAGDVSTAEGRLDLATTVLLKLQTYVKPKSKGAP